MLTDALNANSTIEMNLSNVQLAQVNSNSKCKMKLGTLVNHVLLIKGTQCLMTMFVPSVKVSIKRAGIHAGLVVLTLMEFL